jgi:hypothetical protein
MNLPSSVPVNTITSAIASIVQSGKEVISKDLSKMTIDTEANSLAVKLKQEESLLLSAKNNTYVQLKVKTTSGTVLSHLPIPMVVTDIINEEVL